MGNPDDGSPEQWDVLEFLSKAPILRLALDELDSAFSDEERQALLQLEARLTEMQVQVGFISYTFRQFETGARELSREAIDSALASIINTAAMRPPLAAAFGLTARRAAEVGKSELAAQLYEEAMRADPSDIEFPYNMGNHFMRLGRMDDAIASYNKALEIDPTSAWSLYNRAHCHYSLGHMGDAIEDFIRSACAGCDVENFHYAIARRIIPKLGFTQFFLEVATNKRLDDEQQQGFLQALVQALHGSDGSWFLDTLTLEQKSSISGPELIAKSLLADILRESPLTHMAGMWKMDRIRSRRTYMWAPVDVSDLAPWYQPEEFTKEDFRPDRVSHLEDLKYVIELAQRGDWRELSWSPHYMSGAIAISAIYGGRSDWPNPVLRLSVPVDTAHQPRSESVAEVASWIASQSGESRAHLTVQQCVGEFAAHHFRASASSLLAEVSLRETPLADRQWTRLTVVPKSGNNLPPLQWELTPKEKGSLAAVRESVGSEIGALTWRNVEPVFREWIIAAYLHGNADEHLAATSRTRQFNALLSTERWRLSPRDWLDCRSKIIKSYDAEIPVTAIRDYLGNGALLDFYVHEIVEDTILRLAVTREGIEAGETYVNSRAGDLSLLLSSQDPDNIPIDGLKGRIENLLIGGIEASVAKSKRLAVVPFGYLRNIPFHALSTVQDAISNGTVESISYLPSASLVEGFGDRHPVRGGCLFVGLDESDDIDIEGEYEIVRGTFDRVTRLVGKEATVARVQDALGDHAVAHFACHGYFDPRSLSGYLDLFDAPLYPWHILLLGEVPSTVVMNACLASVADRFEPTSDTTFGLHHAFLAAGSSHVIGGLWEVNEWSARSFSDIFYGKFTSGESAAASVVHAQRALRNRTSDPFLWAVHCFYGDCR